MEIPIFDWPKAPFPALRYPLGSHVAQNEAEEPRCLEEVERLIAAWKFSLGPCFVRYGQ